MSTAIIPPGEAMIPDHLAELTPGDSAHAAPAEPLDEDRGVIRERSQRSLRFATKRGRTYSPIAPRGRLVAIGIDGAVASEHEVSLVVRFPSIR